MSESFTSSASPLPPSALDPFPYSPFSSPSDYCSPVPRTTFYGASLSPPVKFPCDDRRVPASNDADDIKRMLYAARRAGAVPAGRRGPARRPACAQAPSRHAQSGPPARSTRGRLAAARPSPEGFLFWHLRNFVWHFRRPGGADLLGPQGRRRTTRCGERASPRGMGREVQEGFPSSEMPSRSFF